MAQTRKVRRNSKISQREQERIEVKSKERKSTVTNVLSKIMIMFMFVFMVVSLLYSAIFVFM